MTVTPVRTSPGPRAERFPWPPGFAQVPEAGWVDDPVSGFGLRYDEAQVAHTWARNLNLTVAQVVAAVREGDLLVDYSCGTGVLARKLLAAIDFPIGVLNVDASKKFLRVALEKSRDDERTAFRLLEYMKAERRLQLLDEAMGRHLIDRGADLLTATNAIHLYPDLAETFGSWHRVLRPGGLVLTNSANVRNPAAMPENWLLDETVEKINEIAAEVVASEPAFEQYRATLEDSGVMRGHKALREKVFPPVRPLDEYLDAFSDAGFTVLHVFDATVPAVVTEWCHLLRNYHDGVLSWVGGSAKVDGQEPTEDALRDRLFLIGYGLQKLFPTQDSFPCTWTYITCRR